MNNRKAITISLLLVMLGVAGFALFPVVSPLLRAATITEYRYESEMGEHIGGGDNRQYTPDNAAFSLTGDLTSLSFSVQSEQGYWLIKLTAPKGEKLHTGHYGRIGSNPNRVDKLPVLWVVSNGNECNEATGKFTINRLDTDDTGTVAILDAEFAQSCESPTAPPLRGIIKYNVDAPNKPLINRYVGAGASRPSQAAIAINCIQKP